MSNVIEKVPSNDELKKMKKIELGMLKEVKRICDKYSIKYFLVGGTLLGAVRHNGFIPWDDDIDIGMLRADYERFLIVAEGELPEFYALVNHKNAEGMGEPFTKMMDTRTKLVEIFSRKTSYYHGVFIDIFPYDNVPDSNIKKFFFKTKNYILRKGILVRLNYDFNKHGIKKIIYLLIKAFFTLFPIKFLKNKYYKNATKYNNRKTKYICSLGGNYRFEKEMICADVVNQVTTLSFEDELFSAPFAYDEYLRNVYDDYMKLPSEEQRVNKHKLVDLEID